jgi:flagellar basal-body rod modification protein FlgD
MSLIPNVTSPTTPGIATAGVATAKTASATSAAAANSASSIQTTFLSLLAQELQNQDPTTPVDSTAMVGQMISLNQLNQLVDINQTLGQVSGTTPTP